MDASPTRISVTKAEQTRQTRAAIIEAAVECLAELGYAGATLQAIVERTGMSRQPVYYHFSSRLELIVEVARQLPTLRSEGFAERVARASTPQERMSVILEIAEETGSAAEHLAAMEMALAVRTDEALAALLRPVRVEAETRADQRWLGYFALADGLSEEQIIAMRQLVVAVLRGLAIERAERGTGPETHREAWRMLRRMLLRELGEGAAGGFGRPGRLRVGERRAAQGGLFGAGPGPR